MLYPLNLGFLISSTLRLNSNQLPYSCFSTFSRIEGESIRMFFEKTTLKACVGASADRGKFGNKVLRCYIDNEMRVVPVNKRSKDIEGLQCVDSLETLVSQSGVIANEIGVSIITPPGVTKRILQSAYSLGIRHYFMQPGTYDNEVDKYIHDCMKEALVVKGCVLVELGWRDAR